MARLTRRMVLKGLLGGAAVTVGLPPLEAFLRGGRRRGMARAAETADGFPIRFGVFFWGNGVLPTRFVPADPGEGDGWALSDQLAPLAAFKSKLTVVSGMRVGVPNVEPHHATACGILTGHPLTQDGRGWTYPVPTIDQVIAAEIGADTRFRSLEFGARPQGMSYLGPNSINPPERSPLALYERVFGGGFSLPGSEGVVDPSLRLQRGVLSAVMDDVRRLQGRVGATDRHRLEQHFDGIRAIEKRLLKLEEDPPNLEACDYPPTPEAEYPDIEGRPQLQEINRAFSDVLALALACDQTRVFFNEFTRPLVNVLFRGVDAGHHRLTHDEPGEQPQVHEIVLQCMEAMAYQLEALDRIQEGDGTLLDHTLLFGTSDVALGKLHSGDDFPILLAGGAGGRIKTDLHYRSPSDENASKALLTMARALGLDRADWGAEEGYTDQGLTAIEV